ncbi:MAG: hypothetical protein HYZ09_04255 [Candidatus Kerfeldbacteria bacterium]|nr:hypothetical protein [Candidatus Kerfeldbacteria bacterium]
MSIPAQLQRYLKKQKLKFDVVEHKTIYTAYDLAQTTKEKLQAVAKTLVLKVHEPKKLSDDPQEQKGIHHVLAVLPAHVRVDLAKVKKLLGAKKVTIASEKEVAQATKGEAGAQTPFGGHHRLKVVMDAGLRKVGHALFGAGSFTHSLRLKVKDFERSEQPVTGAIAEKPKRKKERNENQTSAHHPR